MLAAATLKLLNEIALTWNQTGADRVSMRWRNETRTAEAHVSYYLTPICEGGLGAAANHSNFPERRGCDVLSSALRFAWICKQLERFRNISPTFSLPCEKYCTFTGNWLEKI